MSYKIGIDDYVIDNTLGSSDIRLTNRNNAQRIYVENQSTSDTLTCTVGWNGSIALKRNDTILPMGFNFDGGELGEYEIGRIKYIVPPGAKLLVIESYKIG